MSESLKPEESIDISGKLDLSKYIHDIPLQPEIRKDLEAWAAQRKGATKSGIAVTLIVFFGVSLLAEFLLIGFGAFYPQANVALIKDTLPLLINSLTAMLSLALAFYFKDK
jgi:hypothetical protein